MDTSNVVESAALHMVQFPDNEWMISSPNFWYGFTQLVFDDDFEGVEFACSTETGSFYNRSEKSFPKEITVESGGYLYWVCERDDSDYPTRFDIDIIAKKKSGAKTVYLGYAVIRVTKHEIKGSDPAYVHYDYIPAVIRSVDFPMLFGQYQEITLEQVNALIKKAKE